MQCLGMDVITLCSLFLALHKKSKVGLCTAAKQGYFLCVDLPS